MKYSKFFLLTALLFTSCMLHAHEYVYNAKCRNFNHAGLFEQCIDKELAFYDGKLNGLYFGFGANKALERSEQLWVKFKETDCSFMARSAAKSINSRLVFKACVLEKTKNRIEELKRINSSAAWFSNV